jgi:hypothetical protein
MEEEIKPRTDRNGSLWKEIEEKAKSDSELTEKLKTANRVIERYSEALQRLADS